MQRFIRSGAGWRVGWDPEASEFKGLVGTDSWAVELTEGELHDFCRLLSQLSEIMNQMAAETMDEEKITCKAESNLLWMELTGYPQAYSLKFILNSGRRAEGEWNDASVVGDLCQAAKIMKVF